MTARTVRVLFFLAVLALVPGHPGWAQVFDITPGGVSSGLVDSVTGAGTVTCTPATGDVTCTGVGAGVGPSYLTLGTDATLTAERVLTAGTAISLTDTGANGTLTVANTGVTSLTGTALQITASAATGAVTLSLPSAVTLPGTLNVTGVTTFAAGTLAAPSGTFTGDAERGLYLQTSSVGIAGGAHVTGPVTVAALATPGSITVTNIGTAGATTYTYKLVATVGGATTEAGAASSTATGNATLDGVNFNRNTWAAVPGATGYRIYRTVGGATQGLIATIALGATVTVDDTGLAGGGETAPTSNASGQMLLPAGSAGAPSYSAMNDPDTGMYINGTNEILWSTGGSQRLYLSGPTLWITGTDALLAFGASQDTFIGRDAANTLALRNGTAAQQFNVYNTHTDASNYERLELSWNVASNVAAIRTAAAGTGTLRSLHLMYGGTASPAIEVPISAATQIRIGDIGLGGFPATAGRVSISPNGGITATSGTHIVLAVADTIGPTATSTLVSHVLRIAPTINYSAGTPGAGRYSALLIAPVETALPTGENLLIEANAGVAGTTAMFKVGNQGNVMFAGTLISGVAVGLSATTTVRDAAGTGTCTLIFTNGIKTGGTC